MIVDGEGVPAGALDAALPALRADLRLDGEAADAELGRCLRAAAGLCEAFTGLALIERELMERVEPRGGWAMLRMRPVRAVTGVAATDGAALLGAHGIEIAADGTGRVRAPGAVTVTYRAGLAADWAGVPEGLALGVVRMAGHLWTERDGAERKAPAAVAALWGPWRPVTLGGRPAGMGIAA